MKIYNLSKSRCGRKIHRSIFQNNANFDLITQFINQKHIASFKSDEQQQSVGSLTCKFNKTLDNLNVSSLEKISELDGRTETSKKGCDVFEDSLVADRTAPDGSVAMSDSCSSFSSHSGRLDMLKNTSKNGLPLEGTGGEFLRDRYFDSAKQYEKEHRRRKTAKKYLAAVKPIKIMDRSVQTSSSDGDSTMSPTSNQMTVGVSLDAFWLICV